MDKSKIILDTAIKEFGEKGFLSASTNNIAKEAKVSKGLIFHYYESKIMLFIACVSSCLEDLNNYCSADIPRFEDPKKMLLFYLQKKILFFRENPMDLKILYEARCSPPSEEDGYEKLSLLFSEYENDAYEQLFEFFSIFSLREDVNKETVKFIIRSVAEKIESELMLLCFDVDTFNSDLVEIAVQNMLETIEIIKYGVLDTTKRRRKYANNKGKRHNYTLF